MIVLLDTENERIKIYGDEGLNVVSFYQIEDIYDYISSKEKVYYITDATLTNVDAIVNLVSNITGKDVNPQYDTSGIHYLHSTSRGPMNVPDPRVKAEDGAVLISFQDKYDMKILDETMEQKIQQFPILAQCIKKGKIEIINEIQKNKILAQKRKDDKTKYQKEKMRDDRLDDIIIKDSSVGSAERLAERMFEDDNIETMEITDSNVNFKTEAEQIASRLGIR